VFLPILFISSKSVDAGQKQGPALQLKQAARHLDKGELDKAEQILQNLQKRTPDVPETFELLGVLRIKQQRVKEAESFFQRAIHLNPRLASPHIHLGYLYKQGNQLEAALRSFQIAATVLPKNAEVLYNIAVVFADLRQFDKAADNLKAIPTTDRPPDYWELLARFYITAGDFVQGEESLRQALLHKPDSISMLRQLAGVALKRNESQRAWQYMAKALELAPNSPDLLYEFAQLSLKNNLGQEAVIAMRKALLLEPDRPEFLFSLGDALLSTIGFHDAVTYLDRYLRLRPDDPAGHLSYGWALYLDKDFDGARKHLEESLRLNPDQVDAYYHLGTIAYETGDRARALELFSRVIQRKPDHAQALLGLGMVYFSDRQYEKARQALESSARINSDEPKVHYQLLQVFARLGDEDGARRERELYSEAQKKVEEKKRLSEYLPFSASPRDSSKPKQQ
jgi:tetratricopeptide (TPR) repeat protein